GAEGPSPSNELVRRSPDRRRASSLVVAVARAYGSRAAFSSFSLESSERGRCDRKTVAEPTRSYTLYSGPEEGASNLGPTVRSKGEQSKPRPSFPTHANPSPTCFPDPRWRASSGFPRP